MAMNSRVDGLMLQKLQSWSEPIVLQEMETCQLEVM